MAITYTKICEHCGVEFTCKHTSGKLCPDCRKESQRIDCLNRYYRKRGVDKHIEFECQKRDKPTKPKSPMFVWKYQRTVCLNNNCPFKHADRPCLFYFEYKDGSYSCALMRRKSKMEKEVNND